MYGHSSALLLRGKHKNLRFCIWPLIRWSLKPPRYWTKTMKALTIHSIKKWYWWRWSLSLRLSVRYRAYHARYALVGYRSLGSQAQIEDVTNNSIHAISRALVKNMGSALPSSARLCSFRVGWFLFLVRLRLCHKLNFMHQRVLHPAQRRRTDVICTLSSSQSSALAASNMPRPNQT